MASPVELNATIVRREDVGPNLMIIAVKPDGPLFDFEAGQYATLGLPSAAPRAPGSAPDAERLPHDKLIRRAYSIASAPAQRDSVEFCLNMVDDGVFTPRLFALRPGDRLWMSAKATGHFTLRGLEERHDALFICTGTGIAPFISMLRAHHTCRSERYWALIHGSRCVSGLTYRGELSALAARCSTFHYLPSVTRPEHPWEGHVGRVPTLIEDGTLERATGRPLAPDRARAYLCGNPEMIADVQAMLEARGFRRHEKLVPGNIHVESYW